MGLVGFKIFFNFMKVSRKIRKEINKERNRKTGNFSIRKGRSVPTV